jgi:hypothetical protein
VPSLQRKRPATAVEAEHYGSTIHREEFVALVLSFARCIIIEFAEE